MIAMLSFVATWPLFKTFYFSFTSTETDNLSEYSFIGFGNYYSVIDGEKYGVLTMILFSGKVFNTISFAVVSVGLQTVLGLIVALHSKFLKVEVYCAQLFWCLRRFWLF